MDVFRDMDAVILAVAHDEFRQLSRDTFDGMFRDKKVLVDVKGMLERREYEDAGYLYWRL